MDLTIKDFVLGFINREYKKRSDIIVNLIDHIEKLNTYYILNDIERKKNLKSIDSITKSLNNCYCERMVSMQNDAIVVSDTKSETIAIFGKDILEKEADSDKNTSVNNLDINLNDKLSSLIPIQSGINQQTFEKIISMSNILYKNEVSGIQLDEFTTIDSKITDIIFDIGCSKLSDILSLYCDMPINLIKFDESELYDIINNLFVPVKIIKLNKTCKKNSIRLTKETNIDERYDVLLENFYRIDLEINAFNVQLSLIIFGYFKIDCVNAHIRLSKITNQYIYNKRKDLITISENSNKVNNKKFHIIPIDFKRMYIRSMTIGELLHLNTKTFVTQIILDYDLYKSYSSMGNPKMLLNEFINGKKLMTKFKIIKLLLLSSNPDNINYAGILFGFTKEQKHNSVIMADIFYKNLNYQLQSKIHKTDINIKIEIEKLNNLDTDDIDLKKQILMNKNMPQKIKKLALEKVNEMKSGNSEYYKQLTYVKTLIDFPWIGENDGDIFSFYKDDIDKWKDIMEQTYGKLNDRVYGHKESKDVIVELLGKWFSNNMSQGKSLALCGPPGTGKSLLCMKLGEALGIPCVKINLGGMEDSSILCGHGITYSSSVPGLIVKKMVEAGKPRCIFYFDELDKTAYHHGRNEIFDVLIHVTDSTTNKEFNDKFFQDLSFDLSKVLFVFSFNDKNKIDPILLDRMEIVKVDAYTIEDKINVTNQFLLKELQIDTGLEKYNITMSNENIIYLIETYTHEAGVRSLRRKIENILLKLNKDRIFMNGLFAKTRDIKDIEITKELIDKYLVKPMILVKKVHQISEIGITNALYATTGGDGGIIPICMYQNKAGKFRLKLTGKLGKVMKESIDFSFTVAINMIKQKFVDTFFNKYKSGLHIHLSDASTSKDGPSGGGVFCLCFISCILGKRIKNDFSMTGELDRDGNITAIGGLNYKLEGCKKSGVKFVFIPKENEKDVNDIVSKNKNLFDDGFKYKLIDNIRQVLDYALIESDGVIDTEITYEKTCDANKYLSEMKHDNTVKKIIEISSESEEESESVEDSSSSNSSNETK